MLTIALSFFVVATFLVSTAVHVRATNSTTPGYYVASMDMSIDPGSESFVISSLNAARDGGATHFVLVLNTFGGDGNSMDRIVGAISDYQANGGRFVTLIAPSARHAFSAGAFVSEASDAIYMTPGTTIGSATPIVSGIPTGEENTTMTKDINGFTAYMQSLTSRFGRNATAAGLMVSKGVSYTAQEASALHVITGLINATSVPEALLAVGVPAGTEVHSPGPGPALLSILSDPDVSGLLFLAGVFAILADLYHPTVILSIVGAAVIMLALVGLGLFGASVTAVILMLIGSVFIFLEVKTHHGISAMAGVIIFAVGFLFIFNTAPSSGAPGLPPTGNFIAPGVATYALLGLLGAGIVVGSIYLYRFRQDVAKMHTDAFDQRRMVGKEGRLTSDLRAGREAAATIASEDWSVTAKVDIPAGTLVRVVAAQGYLLVVEPIP